MVVPTSGNANSYTSGLTGSVATSYDKLKSVSGDAMVGYFNYQGKTALYVVNNQMYDVGETTATQDITLTFDADYKNIKKTELISSIFSDHNTMRLEINYKKKTTKRKIHGV